MRGGLSADEALRAFVAACKRHDTLFITDRWFAPRKEKLLALLSDPITVDEAHVLQELLWQRIVSFRQACVKAGRLGSGFDRGHPN